MITAAPTPAPLAGERLVESICAALNDALAEHITVVDLRACSGVTDHFIVCQCSTTVHNRACADRVVERLALSSTRAWQREGLEDSRWILLDYSDVVVHIMLADLRSYYNLEGVWKSGIVRRVAAQ